jgi:hypothetical protein
MWLLALPTVTWGSFLLLSLTLAADAGRCWCHRRGRCCPRLLSCSTQRRGRPSGAWPRRRTPRVDLVPRCRGRPRRRSRASFRREGHRNCNMRHGGRLAVVLPRCCCWRWPRTRAVAPHADHHIVHRCLPKLLLPVSSLSSSSSSSCSPFKFSTYHFITLNECVRS